MVRREISDMIQSYNFSPSLPYWNSLLNYFERSAAFLSLEEIQTICEECERCRTYANENLNLEHIRREDVFPNIYSYLEAKRREEEHKDEKLVLPFFRHDVSYPTFVQKYS